jgi:sirohydrochlorin cobaltochelatase
MAILSGALGLRHAALECTDLKKSAAFYCDNLGFTSYYDGDVDWGMLFLGDTYLSLVPVNAVEKSEKRGSHQTHLGLVYSSRADIDALHADLSAKTVKVSKVETHRDGSYGFYVADPDGNALECITIPHRSHSEQTTGEAWVLIAHGSRDPRWAEPFKVLAETLQTHVPTIPVHLCFMEMTEPSLHTVVDKIVASGVRWIQLFPVFLSGGGAHMQRDIPGLVDACKTRFPSIEFTCSKAIGETALVQQAMVASIVRSARVSPCAKV